MLKKWLQKEFAEMRARAKAQRAHAENHCGACAHDCPLKKPGCGVGREAAARRGIRIED